MPILQKNPPSPENTVGISKNFKLPLIILGGIISVIALFAGIEADNSIYYKTIAIQSVAARNKTQEAITTDYFYFENLSLNEQLDKTEFYLRKYPKEPLAYFVFSTAPWLTVNSKSGITPELREKGKIVSDNIVKLYMENKEQFNSYTPEPTLKTPFTVKWYKENVQSFNEYTLANLGKQVKQKMQQLQPEQYPLWQNYFAQLEKLPPNTNIPMPYPD